MATYYVGPGGSDSNNGLTWGARKLTLNGAEDIPLAPGDTVYVGPGTYRERLVCDVSGTAGNFITYIADVTGVNTDGVGGIVRITGSDDDIIAVRANGISLQNLNYRKFQGFHISLTTSVGIILSTTISSTHCIIEGCHFQGYASVSPFQCGYVSNLIIRNCTFTGTMNQCLIIFNLAFVDNMNILVENCIFIANGSSTTGIGVSRIGGIQVKNCLFIGVQAGVKINLGLNAGQTVTVTGCTFLSCPVALSALTLGEIIEDYNNIYNCSTPRTNTSTGANSTAYPPLLEPPLLYEGYKFPYSFGQYSQWSLLSNQNNPNTPTADMYGVTRKATAKSTIGPVEYQNISRITTTNYSLPSAVSLPDTTRVQFKVPVTAVSTTFSVRCYIQSDYAGTNPQVVIKQPGQSDTTLNATGGSGSWQLLTTTIIPSSGTDYVVIELVSHNTATSGLYAVLFDDLVVT